MSNPIITVVNGKLVINGITFEHNQLLESKQYLHNVLNITIHHMRFNLYFGILRAVFIW